MLNYTQIEENKDRIISLLRSVSRDGIDNIIEYLVTSGYFTTPSSEDRHHNWKGGLAEHCLGVYETAIKNATNIPTESVIIASLLHDVCKARKLYYGSTGKLHHRHLHIKGHGYRSVKLIQLCGFKLTEDERLAIIWHMGGHHTRTQEDQRDLQRAKSSRLWQIINKADKWDASGKNLNLVR